MKTSIELDHANLKVYFYGSNTVRNVEDVIKIEHNENLMVITTGNGLTKLLNFANVNLIEEIQRESP